MLVRDDGSSMLELKDESKLVRDGDGGSGDGGEEEAAAARWPT